MDRNENIKKVYISLNKRFCRQWEDRLHEGEMLNRMRLPKGTMIDGKDVGGCVFSPKYMHENIYNQFHMTATYYVDPERGMQVTLLSGDGEKIKVDVEDLREAVEAQRMEYANSLVVENTRQKEEEMGDKAAGKEKEKDDDIDL